MLYHCTVLSIIPEDVNPCQHLVFLINLFLILLQPFLRVWSGISSWFWFVFTQLNHTEHLSMCLLVTHMQFLEICLFKFFANFVIFHLFLNYGSSSYILDNNFFTICMIWKCFLPIHGLSILFMVSFSAKKLSILMKSNQCIFFFCYLSSWYLRRFYFTQDHKDLCLFFLPRVLLF